MGARWGDPRWTILTDGVDKRSKEIYEGDIFGNGPWYPIEFLNGSFRAVLAGARVFYLDEILENGYHCGYEVIGNEFENPELLKV